MITRNISQHTKEGCFENDLLRELLQYDHMGIPLFMDGRRKSPRSIARACTVAEGWGYMRDYRTDRDGHISRVDFDYVRNPADTDPKGQRY